MSRHSSRRPAGDIPPSASGYLRARERRAGLRGAERTDPSVYVGGKGIVDEADGRFRKRGGGGGSTAGAGARGPPDGARPVGRIGGPLLSDPSIGRSGRTSGGT